MRGMNSLVAPTKRQNYADGGVVGAIKGMFGIKPEDPERARRLAEYQANAAREKEAAKAATAPAPAPAPAITDYAAGSALKRREAAAGLKDGGPVRGPGTGTSDDVPDNVPEGTYIMPADSTQAIGEKTLGGLGMRGIDVNLSNGEFKLPPKQVHAIGVQTLNQLKDATHTPSSTEAAKGMKPELFFEGGGVASEEERQKRLQNQTAMYVQGAQEAAATRAPQTQPAAVTPMATQQAPAVAPAAPSTSPSTPYKQDRARWEDNLDELQNPTPYRGQVGNLFLQPSGTAAQVAAIRPGVYRGDAGRGTVNPPAVAPQNTTQPQSATDTASTSLAGADRGTVNPPTVNPSAPAPSNAPAAAPEVMPGVYRHGRGQYSDKADGMGMPANFTGQPSAENMARMDAIANRSQQESMNRVQARGMGAVGGPGSGPVEPGSFTGGFSGVIGSANLMGSRTPEQQRRDAEVSASSIHKPTAARGMAALAAMDGRALEQERGQNSLAQENARQAGALEREGIQQAGATQRAGMTAGTEQQRLGIEASRAAGEAETRGFQTRAAGRQEKLYERYQAAKTDEERSAIAKQIRDLSGKADKQDARMEVVRGSVDPMTGKRDGDYAVIFDPSTQTARQVPVGGAQAQQPSAAPKAGDTRNGYRFKGGNPNDQSNWVKV